MFYEFRQNNSGGRFEFDGVRGITHYVIVEADTHDEAIDRAENIGLYFDGIELGSDCDCCGDRWFRAWADEGTEVPCVYEDPVLESGFKMSIRWMEPNPEVFIHYKNGEVLGVMGDE